MQAHEAIRDCPTVEALRKGHSLGSILTPSDTARRAVMEAVERVTRIELVPEAWEAAVLPLNYTRVDTKF